MAKKTFTEVPSWAGSLVGNHRRQAKIPDEVTDLALFTAIENSEPHLYRDVEDQIAVVREELGLPPLEVEDDGSWEEE